MAATAVSSNAGHDGRRCWCKCSRISNAPTAIAPDSGALPGERGALGLRADVHEFGVRHVPVSARKIIAAAPAMMMATPATMILGSGSVGSERFSRNARSVRSHLT